MRLLDALVEQRIAAAAAACGGLDDGPEGGVRHTGEEEDARVPQAARVASRILKEAGFEPPAPDQLRALCDLPADLQAVGGRAARQWLQARPHARLLAHGMALESLHGGPPVLPREYCRRIAERLCARAAPFQTPGAGAAPLAVYAEAQ
jgi:hypothetical protein